MAITAAQRTAAVALLLSNYGDPVALNKLIPGLTPAILVTDIVNAIGTNFDTPLTTALGNVVTNLNTQLTATQAAVTSLQAQITADTVV